MDRNTFYNNLKDYEYSHKCMNKTDYLQHSGQSALLGTQRENVNYYKREGEPGNYRYYYTKEEYDAAHKNNETSQESNIRNINSADNSNNRKNKSAKTEQQKQNKKQSKQLSQKEKQEKINKKYNNAEQNKKFDKKFVKMIKNTDDMTDEERLIEYKKYLVDPDNFQREYVRDRLTVYQEGGNVNLNLRPEISAEELKKAGWNTEDGYATVFSSTYSGEDGSVGNFTPIQMDPVTGEFIKVLEPEEFDNYCWDVMDGLRDDDLNLKIGSSFSGKDALERAQATAERIHKLHAQLHQLNNQNK